MEIARHGIGGNETAEQLAAIFNHAGFSANVHLDLTGWRYAKLLANLANAADAVMGKAPEAAAYAKAARSEGIAVLAAAGIVPADLHAGGRRDLARTAEIPGYDRVGLSSTQSLARAAGSIETDFLNGEIVLMGRKLGVATPVNAWFGARAQRMMDNREQPGSVGRAEVEVHLGRAGRPAYIPRDAVGHERPAASERAPERASAAARFTNFSDR